MSTKILGKGGFGTVLAATLEDQPCVCKIPRPEVVEAMLFFERECSLLSSISHPNVVPVLHISRLPDGRAEKLFLPDCGRSLFDILDGEGDVESPDRLFYQVLDAASHLHSLCVMHRDIKLENIMLDEMSGRVRLIDFGMSVRRENSVLSHPCGSIMYSCPESLTFLPYDGKAADSWSIGISFFCTLFKCFPFQQASKRDWRFVQIKDLQDEGKDVKTCFKVMQIYNLEDKVLQFDSKLVSIIDGLLNVRPLKRLLASDAFLVMKESDFF